MPRLRDLGVRRLLLVPHHELHQLPLHACWTRDADGTRRYLADELTVGYAPSLAVLAHTSQRPLPAVPRILAVLNPDATLVFAARELDGIAPPAGEVRALPTEEATLDGLRATLAGSAYDVTHLSCHGSYDLSDPLRSALALRTPDRLSLADLYGVGDRNVPATVDRQQDGQQSGSADDVGRLRMEQALVVMSACETALSALQSPSDEYEGLPAGLIFAGAAAVVGTLWRVSDLSTAILMSQFYKEWLDRPKAGDAISATGVGIAEALRRAQRAVREMTAAQVLKDWLTDDAVTIRAIPSFVTRTGYQDLRAFLQAGDLDARPFAAVEYWAGACAIGHVW